MLRGCQREVPYLPVILIARLYLSNYCGVLTFECGGVVREYLLLKHLL